MKSQMAKCLQPMFGFLLFLLFIGSTVSAPIKDQRTPPSIKTIFEGRCLEYQEVVRPELFPPRKRKHCGKLWKLFKSAFAFKDACQVPVDNYETYSRKADYDIDTRDKVMFWNGNVFPFVETYAAYTGKYIIIRDILSVYTVKNIENWCGTNENGSGMNFDTCPQWGHCQNLSISSFWKHMSKKFALKAQGVVHVMLNASSGTAFREESTFGQMELPNLNSERTPKLIAHLVRNLDEKPKETCTSGSPLKLKKLIEAKNMNFECFEDERDIRFLQCALQEDKKDCKLLI